MKTFTLFNILIMISALFMGCEENEIKYDFNIQGDWYPVNSYGDIVSFGENIVILSKVEYHYTIENDSIIFEYAGPLYMPVIPSKHHLFYDKEKSVLVIENINKKLPALGKHDQIELIRSELKEKIVGNWLNVFDTKDTLEIINSFQMKYKNIHFNYSLSKDSIEVISQLDQSCCNGTYNISLMDDSLKLNMVDCNIQYVFQEELIFIK